MSVNSQFLCYIKRTHTVYFSSSLYIINQKPMIPRTDFHCGSVFTSQMALFFNIKSSLIVRPDFAL